MSPSLEERGVSFPSFQRGKAFAHHWLAGSLKGPHAYKTAQDNITEMIDVAKTSNSHTVCFSSEDFETHLRHPKALARLMKIADQLKATPVFLIYLRNQVEYLESLYLQFVRMGLKLDASEVIDQVIETGQFKWRKWVIQFDYATMIESLAATKGDIIVRSYHELENNCIIQDFLTCIGQPVDLKPQAENLRPNSTRLKRNLQRFAKNRESNLDATIISEVDKRMDGLRPRLSSQAQEKIRNRFWAGNHEIEAQLGVRLNQRFDRSASSSPVPVIDCIFETKAIDFLSSINRAANPSKAMTNDIELPEDWLAAV